MNLLLKKFTCLSFFCISVSVHNSLGCKQGETFQFTTNLKQRRRISRGFAHVYVFHSSFFRFISVYLAVPICLGGRCGKPLTTPHQWQFATKRISTQPTSVCIIGDIKCFLKTDTSFTVVSSLASGFAFTHLQFTFLR